MAMSVCQLKPWGHTFPPIRRSAVAVVVVVVVWLYPTVAFTVTLSR